jgi:ATP/maltotriose-dependent transcriptional regulator MalT
MQPLIRTKFFIPALRDNIVPRPLLLEKMALGAQKALTLICAPAGYGKTRCWLPELLLYSAQKLPPHGNLLGFPRSG